MHSAEFTEEMKQLLLATKAQLTEELAGLSSHTEVGEDPDENASEIEMDEVSQDVMSRIQGDLAKIETALSRIEQGVYGIDINTKEDIAEDRLRVLPWAETGV